MLDWERERNWRGAVVVFSWIAVLSGFLVMKASPVATPDRAPVPTS
jgi:hypothetical protein